MRCGHPGRGSRSPSRAGQRSRGRSRSFRAGCASAIARPSGSRFSPGRPATGGCPAGLRQAGTRLAGSGPARPAPPGSGLSAPKLCSAGRLGLMRRFFSNRLHRRLASAMLGGATPPRCRFAGRRHAHPAARSARSQRVRPYWPMRTTPGSVMADSASGASMAAATRGGGTIGIGAFGFKHFHAVTFSRQLQSQQAAHQAGARNGNVKGWSERSWSVLRPWWLSPWTKRALQLCAAAALGKLPTPA